MKEVFKKIENKIPDIFKFDLEKFLRYFNFLIAIFSIIFLGGKISNIFQLSGSGERYNLLVSNSNTIIVAIIIVFSIIISFIISELLHNKKFSNKFNNNNIFYILFLITLIILCIITKSFWFNDIDENAPLIILNNVGIGTTSPEAMLALSSLIQSDIPLFQVASTTGQILLEVKANGDVTGFNYTGSWGMRTSTGAVSKIFTASTSNELYINISKNSSQNGDLLLGNLIMDTRLASGSSTVMWMGIESDPVLTVKAVSDGAGSYSSYGIGIGTSEPKATLSIENQEDQIGYYLQGHEKQSMDLLKVVNYEDKPLFVIDKDGNTTINGNLKIEKCLIIGDIFLTYDKDEQKFITTTKEFCSNKSAPNLIDRIRNFIYD